MGILDWIKNKFRKDWMYELQVFENGWVTITQPTDKKRKEDYQELFVPGKLYRLMRKDPDTYQYDKMVWRHYEPAPVIPLVQRKKERPPPERSERPLSPADFMRAYVEGLREYMEPVRMFGQIARELREAFSGTVGGEGASIPPIEFEGKAPWFMHPYVAKTWGDIAKEVIDHGAKRLGEVIEKAKSAITPTEEAAPEEAEFPRLEEYEEYPEEYPEEVVARSEVEIKPSQEEKVEEEGEEHVGEAEEAEEAEG